MKFDFESLSTEPLFYMLMHSGAFVCVLGFIFFVVGLLFGYATWGRFKRQTRGLRSEVEAMKDEIAGLKRKVGDHSVKSGPTIAMATETIHMPKKEGTTAAEAIPAITEETITTQDIRLQPPAEEPLPKSRANVIKPKATSQVTPPPEPATASATLSPSEPPPPPARHFSPLSAIIATPPVKEESIAESDTTPPVGLVPADTLPALTELPVTLAPAETLPALTELPVTPLPAVEIHPMLDPKLGLIYKTQPQHIDDLTALKGIAQVLEQRLHEFGIYTYAQIAAWDDDQIKEFSARLAFKDRIQREHWVEQARQLAAKSATV